MTRDEAIAYGKEQLEIFGGLHKEFIQMAIEALERKRGEWIEDGYQGYPCVCSFCGTPQDIKAKFLFSFCPNCGAKMNEFI